MAVKIGQRIAEARAERRWSLKAAVAHLAGWGESRLSNYETGQRMPGPTEILALAEVLGESAAYLMCLTDDRHPEVVRGATESLLLTHFRLIDPPERTKVLERLGAFAMLKMHAIEDGLEHLSAKGKPRPVMTAKRKTNKERK